MDRAVHRLLPSVTSVLLLLLLLSPTSVSCDRRLLTEFKTDDEWEVVPPDPAIEQVNFRSDGPAEGPVASFGNDQVENELEDDDPSESISEPPSSTNSTNSTDSTSVKWIGRGEAKVQLAQNNGSGSTTYFKPIALGLLVITAMAAGLVAGAFGGLFFLRILRKK